MEPTSTSHPHGVVYPNVPEVVVGVPARTEPQICEHFPHRLSLGLGIAQVIAAGLCVLFSSISVIWALVYYGVLYIGHGIWSGILVGSKLYYY